MIINNLISEVTYTFNNQEGGIMSGNMMMVPISQRKSDWEAKNKCALQQQLITVVSTDDEFCYLNIQCYLL